MDEFLLYVILLVLEADDELLQMPYLLIVEEYVLLLLVYVRDDVEDLPLLRGLDVLEHEVVFLRRLGVDHGDTVLEALLDFVYAVVGGLECRPYGVVVVTQGEDFCILLRNTE